MSAREASDISNSEFVHIVSNHEAELCSRLYKQWQDGENCDLLISLPQGQVHTHSCVLAAFSPKLKAILNNPGQFSMAGNSLFVQLTFEEKIFHCLLNMMYTGVLSFHTSLLPSMLSTARWLQMDDVVEICQNLKQDIGQQAEDVALTETAFCHLTADNIKQEPIVYFPGEYAGPVQSETLGNSQDPAPHLDTSAKKSKRKKSGSAPNLPKRPRGRPRKVDKIPNVPSTATVVKQEPESEGYESYCDISASFMNVASEMDHSLAENTTTGTTGKRSYRKAAHRKSPKSTKNNKPRKTPRSSSKTKQKGASMVRKTSLNEDRFTLAELELPPLQSMELEMESGEKADRLDTEEADFTMGKTDHIRCKRCLSKFRELESYLEHMRNHPMFKCDECTKTYYRQSNLTRHKRLRHSDSHHLRCKKCDFEATTEKKLRLHSKEMHEDDKPFSCDYPGCSYSSWKFHFLQRHTEIHSNVKNYMCNKCGQGFSQYAGLLSHHRTCYHMQEFLCDLCGQSFNHVQSMRAHRRTIHFGEKPYLCKVCGNQFSDQRNLKRHMRIHENTFPYQCPVCQQNYRHSNSLKAHLKKHGDLGLNIQITAISRRQSGKKKAATKQQQEKPGEEIAGNDSGVAVGMFADTSDSEAKHPASMEESGAVPPAKLQQLMANMSHPLRRIDALIPEDDSLGDRVLAEHLPSSTNSIHSALFAAVPFAVTDPRREPDASSSSSCGQAVMPPSITSTSHRLLAPGRPKFEPLMNCSATSVANPMTSDAFVHNNKDDVSSLGPMARAGDSETLCVESRTAAGDADRAESDDGSDVKGKGQGYGLQRLTDMCFKSTV